MVPALELVATLSFVLGLLHLEVSLSNRVVTVEHFLIRLTATLSSMALGVVVNLTQRKLPRELLKLSYNPSRAAKMTGNGQ